MRRAAAALARRAARALGLRIFVSDAPDGPLLKEALIVDVAAGNETLRFLISNPTDAIQKYHVAGEIYEPEELDIMLGHFPPGGTFIDIGANVGNHAIYAARIMGAGHVIAFEPARLQHTLCMVNLALNDVADLVELRAVALSDRASVGRIVTERPDNIGGARLVRDGRGERVTLSTGDAALTGVSPDLIKIDIEGHEMQALAGLSDTIEAHRPCLFIEVLNELAPAMQAWCTTHRYTCVQTYKRYPRNENWMLVPSERLGE